MKILVLGDCHVDDEQDLSRFSLASQLILDHKPEHIVIIGDFLTLNCLSRWDRDKRLKMEGKRYSKEIEAGNISLDMLLNGIDHYNDKRREGKRSLYKPNIVYIEGNHEERLKRYLESDPTFEGFVSIEKDLHLRERNISYIPYREYYYINDIGFTHIPHNKVKPVDGLDVCRKVSAVTVKSTVFGHTHSMNVSNFHKEGQDHLQQILNVGCFISKKEDYVHGRVTEYWRGLVLLDSWKPGRFDIETFSLGRLERLYQ